MSVPVLNSSLSKIEEYYDVCWTERFERGHNPKSLAMHLGFYEHGNEDSEAAKINLNRVLAKRLGISRMQNPVLVDAGCGVGGTSIYLARHFPHARIKCLNSSARQLQLAERFAAQAGVLEGLEFIQCDFSSSGLRTESADAVFAVESLCHAGDKQRFFAEMWRLLKPGGKFAAFDYIETDLSHSEENLPYYRRFCEGWAVERYLLKPLEHLKSAGFTDVLAEDLTQKVYPGVLRSEANARFKLQELNQECAPPVERHYQACIALKYLAGHGGIIYSYLGATKPLV